MPIPGLPKSSDPPEAHADWLEWRVLKSSNGYISWSEHQRDLRIEGGDESAREEWDAEALERLLDDIAAELSDRKKACGGPNDYPFEITPDGLARREGEKALIYKFLLLLTLVGRQAGPPGSHGERLFEDLSAEAFAAYLGKPLEGHALTARADEEASPHHMVGVNVFGFPRRIGPRDFPRALDQLCREIGEGVKHLKTPRTEDQKDAHLDLVAWRAFPDSRAGKLIAFGQCATGENWFEKIRELRPAAWCKLWLTEPLLVDPITCFFLPRRVERDLWRETISYGGIVFDRCRISWLAHHVPPDLADSLAGWTEHALGTVS